MSFFKKLFGRTDSDKKDVLPSVAVAVTPTTPELKRTDSSQKNNFPAELLGKMSMGIINYEGSHDKDLEISIVKRMAPLAQEYYGFKAYSNAMIPTIKDGELSCGLIRTNGGLPISGVSLDTYMAYEASKNAFPPGSPGYGRNYNAQEIGYWIGTEKGKQVHVVLLF